MFYRRAPFGGCDFASCSVGIYIFPYDSDSKRSGKDASKPLTMKEFILTTRIISCMCFIRNSNSHHLSPQ